MCCLCSNQVSQDAVVFKSDTGDPLHLRGVIMHQSARCISKRPVMVCALGFIFPIKSANYMIISYSVMMAILEMDCAAHFALSPPLPYPTPKKIIEPVA